ncbi:hypothetical protein [Nonomuraea wenchangensis]|uniref:Uncharacterized protein n=1 Tax=Nonomuraea wenchangensis TaxID=568860 RepID=A0A1I0LTM5_9ACTN|nr:hypothetical protein [Nonomuraea wenchangensis]SEU46501.1 hypothetical protein SAMN05421811_12755 [Nonomuraea wenchangensis]
MASFVCVAYVLERAADIMLGDLSLSLEQALTRTIWSGQPANCDDCDQQERYRIAAHVVELYYSDVTYAEPASTGLADIPRGSARSAAREVARLFRQVGDGEHLEGDDPEELALRMWGLARGVELVR